MNKSALVAQICKKKSMLCVGLDTDPSQLPNHLLHQEDGVLNFNKAIIEATLEYAIAYKINTAFYEAQGVKGWQILEDTLKALPQDTLRIADAKRGDIGNTATQYARTFFETLPFDAVTVAPYMGADSVQPFLQFKEKWAIVLGLTSNAGHQDFQMLDCGSEKLYEKVMSKVASWGSDENIMFVTGATRVEQLEKIRTQFPKHFLLVPGVGAQGGTVEDVCKAAANEEGGLLINVSRGITQQSKGEDFAEQAALAAKQYQQQMAVYL